MTLTRRQWLKGAGTLTAASMLPWPLRASQSELPLIHLQARESTAAWLDTPTPVWSYAQPTLRLRQGVAQRIRVTNHLPEPTTVHWHGLRVANAMDGVSGLTQAPIEPGESFDYEVMSPDAGTFWFHSHHNTIEQLARGLYGALIVSGDNEPDFEQDWPLLIDDWRLTKNGRIDPAFASLHTQAHGGRMGNVLTINHRLGPWQGRARSGDRVRLRLVNSATNRILQLRAEFPSALVLAKDGQPLTSPEPLPDVFILGPGERLDLGWLANETGQLMEVSGRKPLVVARVEVEPGGEAGIPRYPGVMALPVNPMPEVSADVTQTVPLKMEGGAMGRLESARYEGETMAFRELVDQGQVWALSGQVGLPEEPLFRARQGETVALQLDNRTSFPHTLHWHGHHVWADDRWQDSLTVTRGQTKTVRMVAGGPGKWLIHCHMIDHQATGMMTWFEVV
ncbi:multicopper oxidase family protein [Saccharospirillum salsuginis]|uniref:Copper oxidase n=1 Tax=Saccharospirillum salsuginis TaxID=418750 RepID=A0A918K5R1_9GAMM|nr:multicopper oxidase family protein [Saccharospirillum salsuginis]GGX48488.1 copper oxidase [Saccharospirillum salsuginis]